MTTGLLALAFGAGMLAPVNPCGFAVLPAFLAYAIDTSTTGGAARSSVAARLAGGLRAGGSLTLGFAGTFTAIGILLAVGMRSLIGVVPWAAATLGGILALAGLAMVAGWHPPLRLPSRTGTPRQRPRGMVAFGAGYALASASCTLAVLLSVVTQALATTNVSGVLVTFGAYAAGSATLLLTLAVFAAFASGLIHRFLRRLLPHINRITGAVLAASGGYLLLYWLPQLLGNGRPGSNALAGVVGGLAVWINAHQLPIALTALGLVTAVAITAIVGNRRSGPTDTGRAPVQDCCATPAEHTGRGAHPDRTR